MRSSKKSNPATRIGGGQRGTEVSKEVSGYEFGNQPTRKESRSLETPRESPRDSDEMCTEWKTEKCGITIGWQHTAASLQSRNTWKEPKDRASPHVETEIETTRYCGVMKRFQSRKVKKSPTRKRSSRESREVKKRINRNRRMRKAKLKGGQHRRSRVCRDQPGLRKNRLATEMLWNNVVRWGRCRLIVIGCNW